MAKNLLAMIHLDDYDKGPPLEVVYQPVPVADDHDEPYE